MIDLLNLFRRQHLTYSTSHIFWNTSQLPHCELFSFEYKKRKRKSLSWTLKEIQQLHCFSTHTPSHQFWLMVWTSKPWWPLSGVQSVNRLQCDCFVLLFRLDRETGEKSCRLHTLIKTDWSLWEPASSLKTLSNYALRISFGSFCFFYFLNGAREKKSRGIKKCGEQERRKPISLAIITE